MTFYRAECDNMGGTKDGTCADGFGICCIGIIYIETNIITEIYWFMFIKYYTSYWFFDSYT